MESLKMDYQVAELAASERRRPKRGHLSCNPANNRVVTWGMDPMRHPPSCCSPAKRHGDRLVERAINISKMLQ